MTQQVDAKNSTTTRTYDALNRLLAESNSGVTQVTNTYDSCTNGIGYLCTASSTSAKTQNAYDILGRITFATTTIAGIGFTTGYTYDQQSNPLTLTYPNGLQASYAYNLAGQVSRVQIKPSGGSWADIASSLLYAPQGLPTNLSFGNGASTTWTFNANALYRLAQLQTFGQGGTTIQNIFYTYDPAGNITQIANTANTDAFAITNFSYDQLNRLTLASTVPITTAVATTSIAIEDALPLATYKVTNATSDSRTYSVPTGGGNNLFVVLIAQNNTNTPSATLDGNSLTFSRISGSSDRMSYYVGYLASPTSGVFQINFPVSTYARYAIFTLQNAAQSSPIDASAVTNAVVSSKSTSVTTSQGNDLLISYPWWISTTLSSFGANENTLISEGVDVDTGDYAASYRKAASTAGAETLTTNISTSQDIDEPVIAFKQLIASTTPIIATSTPYNQSFSYDWLGNLLSITNSASGATSSPTAAPSILDTLPATYRTVSSGTSDSFSYTVPAGGSHKEMIVQVCMGGGTPSATQNGASVTFTEISGDVERCYHWYGVLANPSSGTFSMNWSNGGIQYSVMTLANVNQSSPVDVSYLSAVHAPTHSTVISTNVTTTVGNDLLLDEAVGSIPGTVQTYGAGQTQTHAGGSYDPAGQESGSYKPATSSAGSETMTRYFSPADGGLDLAVVAVKGTVTPTLATTSVYTYAQTSFANPDAVTQIANGSATTTYAYDANGNLTQAGGWSYMWDYLNRMLSSGFGNSTTTYAYDEFGSRVLQTSTTSTTYYPNKYFSTMSTIVGSTTYATTTDYIWNGDTLLATIDQPMINGTATGTPITRFIHPDHLGSTNAVTDQNGNLVQTLDYYPFGASRISVSTSTNEARKYIGQFSDQNSGLDYLQARYYDSARGQFVNEDPVFWSNKQNLADPQSFNVYSYANDNPINRSDPSGLAAYAYSRSVDPNSALLNLYAHNFIYIVPGQGEALPALYSNGMCIDTTRPFTLGGYNDRRSVFGVANVSHLAKHANDSYDYNLASAQQSAYGVAMTPIRPNSGITPAQQDAALVNSYNQQPDDYGLYGGVGLLGLQNSNNVFTTVQQGAGVNVAEISRQQSTLQSATQRPAPGVEITQNASISNIINTLSTLVKTLSTLISHQTPSR